MRYRSTILYHSLMWEIDLSILRLDIVDQLLQAVQERNHGKIETSVV